MKKILSCMLAVAMMLSLLCAVPAQAAPYEGYPFVFEDYEDGIGATWNYATWTDADGAGGSNGSVKIKLTGGSNQDVQINCTEAPQENAKLKFSAWIKMENDVAAGKDSVSFIVYGKARFPLTDPALAGEGAPDHVIKDGWLQVTASNVGLKKGEWVYATLTHTWNGTLTAFPTAGYGGVTSDNQVATTYDILSFNRLAMRVAGGGTSGLANPEDGSLNFYMDDVCYEAIPNDMAAADISGKNIVKGGEMNTVEDLRQLGVDGAPEIVAATADDPAPDGSAGYLKMKPKNGVQYWPQISQTMHWQPNHLYHVSFYMRLDTPRDEGKTTANVISSNDGKISLDMEYAGAWLLQLCGARIQDPNGMNSEYPGRVCYNVVNFDNGWQKVEYYFTHEHKTTANQQFTTWLRLFPNRNKDVQTNASFSMDALRIVDMGSVSNGDFETEPNGVITFKNQKDVNQDVLGWTGSNATASYSDDVAEDSEGTKSMKVTVTGAGGAAMQGIEMKQDQTYKLTFKAKGLSNTSPVPLALQLDRYVTSVYKYDVWDTPNYEYYYGTNKKTTSYSPNKQSDQEWYLTNEWQTYTCYIDNTYGLLEGKTMEDAKAYHEKNGAMVYDGTTMPRLPVMYWNVNGNAPGTEYLIDDVKIEGVNTFPVISNLKVNGEVAPGKEISVSYDYESALNLADTNSIVRVYNVDAQGRRAALGTFPAKESFVIPENAIGKTLEVEVLPIDESKTCGYAVATGVQMSDTWGAKLYAEDAGVRAYAAKDTGAFVIFAAYEGKELLDVKTVPVTLVANTKAEVPVPEGFITEGATEVKVMLWRDLVDAEPLCVPVAK